MRTIAAIAACIALSLVHARFAEPGEQPRGGSGASTRALPISRDQLHFVSVLTIHGVIVAVDYPNLLVTVKSPTGKTSILQARSETDLERVKVGDHVRIRYFEGGQISRTKQREIPAFSLKNGIMEAKLGGPSAKKHEFVAKVEAIDPAEQEITLEGPDGSLETIVVANPEYLRNIKVGDRVGLAGVQARALSFEKERVDSSSRF
jgi:hypothetical protein